MSKFKSALDRYFHITERGSKFSTEIIAGLTTFLAMVYILTVNPSILSTPNPNMHHSLFIATVLGAFIGTVLMGLLAKLPFAQASGMGINAMVAFTLVLGQGMSYGEAMWIIILSGAIFLLLTLVGVREKILDSIPKAVRVAIPVGIGLFIAFIGMQNAGLIVSAAIPTVDFTTGAMTGIDPVTIVKLVDFGSWTACSGAVICLISFMVIAILTKLNVKGAMLIGILAGTLIGGIPGVGVGAGQTDWAKLGTLPWYPDLGVFFGSDPNSSTLAAVWGSIGDSFQKMFAGTNIFNTLMLILTFCMLDMFDTFGTLYGAAKKGNLIREDGSIPGFKGALLADSIATVAGAALGTSTVTTFVESTAGVAVGGKTGFTAMVIALLFLVSLFLYPIFALVPSAAAAAALLFVGVLMISQVRDIEFHDLKIAVPAFLTIVMMPLGYSITGGIGFGMISYCLLEIVTYIVDICKYNGAMKTYAPTTDENGVAVEAPAKPKFGITVVTAIVAVLFILYFVFGAH